MIYKLYSAGVRSRLEVRAPYLEKTDSDVQELKNTSSWMYTPSVITDEDGNVIESNGIGDK